MSKCKCGDDMDLLCPKGKGCGCICWDDLEGGQECLVWCQGDKFSDILDMPELLDVSDVDGRDLAGIGSMLIRSTRKKGKLQINSDQHVHLSTHDLPIASLATVISKILDAEVWIPTSRRDERITMTYDGCVTDACKEFGLRL